MRTIENLNLKYVNASSATDSDLECSAVWYDRPAIELVELVECDFDSAELIKTYLTDDSAIEHNKFVRIWFN